MSEPTQIEVRLDWPDGRHVHVQGTPDEVAQALEREGIMGTPWSRAKGKGKEAKPPESKAAKPVEDKSA